MDSNDFCRWLQKLIEKENPKEFGSEQLKLIKNHLGLVFIPRTSNLVYGVKK